jgi:hypothetical protein
MHETGDLTRKLDTERGEAGNGNFLSAGYIFFFGRLAVLECGFLLFSVSGNADAGVSLITIRALRGRRSSSKMRLFAVSLSGLNIGM